MYRIPPDPPLPEQSPPASTNDERRTLLASLLSDPEWKCDQPTRTRLEALQQCLQSPTAVDARDSNCPAEAEWMLLGNEIERYLDFRRLHQLEARLHQCNDTDFHFDRHDWEVAHEAEVALAAHLRHVHEESYVPEQVDSYLHVH